MLALTFPIAVLAHLTFASGVDWRPMGQRDPLSDPTHEYLPPMTTGVHYWGMEQPSLRLEPPPPGLPLPWLTSAHVSLTTAYPVSPTTSNITTTLTMTTTVTPTTTVTSTTTLTPTTAVTSTTTVKPPAMVIEGHSKVKKYGPVRGSINSVLHLSGKLL